MSAVFADIPLCLSTPEVRAWVERHVPLHEALAFQHPPSPPTIFHGLTYFPRQEQNVPLRLNVLRWPSGASRWATYHFLATDEQLVDIRAEVYGDPEADPADDKRNASRKLILHGGGETITCNDMWLLPPRPLSTSPSFLNDVNNLWLCTLVDQRYFWNQKHCGDLSESGTWDELLQHLRDQVGLSTGMDTSAWDCPAVDSVWLLPHVDLLAAHSLPLGMMIDAVAWNVGRRVSVDLEKTSESYPPIIHVRDYSWHDTRAQANLTTADWYRMAGGTYQFPDRDLSAALPEKIRVTWADGIAARDHQEVAVNHADLESYEDENGVGTVVFHDRLDVNDASDSEREALLKAIAKAYLGFTAKASFDVTYAGHVKWLPEALSDAIEWHELHDEGYCLVPDPDDGKVRQRREHGNLARTRVVRPPFNLLAEDLWHGNGGAGSGSGAVPDFTVTCPDGTQHAITISGSDISVTEVED
jgi:hypothetical protein